MALTVFGRFGGLIGLVCWIEREKCGTGEAEKFDLQPFPFRLMEELREARHRSRTGALKGIPRGLVHHTVTTLSIEDIRE